MGETTGISWCDHTFNPWIGCTKVGPGCDHCYAEAQDARFSPDQSHWGVGAPRRVTSPTNWREPDKWNRKAQKDGVRRRVFCASQADLFDKEGPAAARANLWPVIERCNSLDWLIVTKRIPNVCDMTPWWWRLSEDAWPLHVWLIITVCNQAEADRDIPRLIDLKRRFGIGVIGLSIEPMLGKIVLRPEWLEALDWVIVGGESGKDARPMHPDWARSLRDQCAAADVAFFFKQWGEWKDGSDFAPDAMAVLADGRVLDADKESLEAADRDDPIMRHNPTMMRRVGKKAAGDFLDGVQHHNWPQTYKAAT